VPYIRMDGTDPKECQTYLETLKDNPIIGVFKTPQSHVFYAVKLTAKAHLLFNPFPLGKPDDGIDLTAYATAQPFGSRIGPSFPTQQDVQNEFTKTQTVRFAKGPQPITY